MSKKNGRFELLLGRIGIFLHLLKVGTRCHGMPPGTRSETGQNFLCPAQPCPAQHHVKFGKGITLGSEYPSRPNLTLNHLFSPSVQRFTFSPKEGTDVAT